MVRFSINPRPAIIICTDDVVTGPDLQVTHSPPVALDARLLRAGPATEVRLGEELPTLEVRLINQQNVQVRVRVSSGLVATARIRSLRRLTGCYR